MHSAPTTCPSTAPARRATPPAGHPGRGSEPVPPRRPTSRAASPGLWALVVLALLPFLAACPQGAPCSWTVTNETGEELTSVRYAEQGWIFEDSVLGVDNLGVSEDVTFEVDAGKTYDLQAFAGDDQFLRLDAATCKDGEELTTTLAAFDRQL